MGNISTRYRCFTLTPYSRAMSLAGLALLAFSACLYLCACAGLPTWLADAQNLLPLFTASAGSILSALGLLTANPVYAAAGAALSKIATEIENGIATVQAMVAAYKADPGDTTLQNVENATQSVITNIQALLGDFGLPSSAAAPYVALAQLLLTQFETWAAAITSIKTAVASSTGIHAAIAVHEAAAKVMTAPMTAAEYQAAANAIVAQYPNSGLKAI
jgi:hypothetical protein